MGKRTLLGLCLALFLTAVVWSAAIAGAAVQDDCSDSFASHPLAPGTPAKLVAFRKAVQGVVTPRQDVTLHWINTSSNANCFSIEARFLSGPDPSVNGGWVLLETIHDPRVNQYLHSGVPTSGEVCYRVYASNSVGRSDYSNRVCLSMGGPPPYDATASGLDSSSEGSGFRTGYLLAIVLPLSALAVLAGAALWRFRPRAHRSRV